VAAAIGVAAPASVLSQRGATAAVVRPAASGAAKGPGRPSDLLTRNTLALENVIQVNLSAGINCAVIGRTAQAPTATAGLAAPVPGSQFPPM
jgi:hypothetical protein